MRRFFVLGILIFVFSTGCNSVSLSKIDDKDKIAVLPSLNFSGYDISKFPLVVYRDAELTRLFEKVDANSANLCDVLQTNLFQRLENTEGVIVKIAEREIAQYKTENMYVLKFLRSIKEQYNFDQAFYCVVSKISLKNLFTEREIYLTMQIVNIDDEGNMKQSAGKDFTIHLSDSAYTPLGVNFTKIIDEICLNMIKELT